MIEILGAIFIFVIGSICHFLYDWTNHNKIVGYFTAVNESTWEHLKLVIAPSLLWFIVECHVYYGNPNLCFAKLISLLVMLSIIPLIFYSYTYFTKKNILWVDISSFMISAIVGEGIFHILINLNYHNIIITHIGIIGLVILFLRYITHTYVPDKNFFHQDPITHKYGISGHLVERSKKK